MYVFFNPCLIVGVHLSFCSCPDQHAVYWLVALSCKSLTVNQLEAWAFITEVILDFRYKFKKLKKDSWNLGAAELCGFINNYS